MRCSNTWTTVSFLLSYYCLQTLKLTSMQIQHSVILDDDCNIIPLTTSQLSAKFKDVVTIQSLKRLLKCYRQVKNKIQTFKMTDPRWWKNTALSFKFEMAEPKQDKPFSN